MGKVLLGQPRGWIFSRRVFGQREGGDACRRVFGPIHRTSSMRCGFLALCLVAVTMASCRLVAVGIPLEETRVLSQQMHRARQPSDREFRVAFSGLAEDGRHILGQVKEVGRCKQWKESRVQVVSTTAYHRRYVPSKAWGWVTTVTGVGLSALGVGLMAANGDGMKGNRDDLDADLQRRRFIGGIWSLLPGLGLAALGVTWLALDADETVVEKGPVQRIREPRGLRDCQVRPLARATLQVSPGDSGAWQTITTDGQGRFRLDLLPILTHLPLAAVPRTFLFKRPGRKRDERVLVGTNRGAGRGNASMALQIQVPRMSQTAVVEADDDLYPRIARLLRIDAITLGPGENHWRLSLGAKDGPLVSRALLTCRRYLDLSLSVDRWEPRGAAPRLGRVHPRKKSNARSRPSRKPAGASATDARAPAGHPGEACKSVGMVIDGMGAEFSLRLGAARKVFCGPGAVARLRIAATAGRPVTYVLDIHAKPDSPAGRVVRVEGRLLALDQGTAGRVLVGRRGFLYHRGKKVGEFSVIEVTRNNAAARLDQGMPERFANQRLTYRLVD